MKDYSKYNKSISSSTPATNHRPTRTNTLFGPGSTVNDNEFNNHSNNRYSNTVLNDSGLSNVKKYKLQTLDDFLSFKKDGTHLFGGEKEEPSQEEENDDDEEEEEKKVPSDYADSEEEDVEDEENSKEAEENNNDYEEYENDDAEDDTDQLLNS